LVETYIIFFLPLVALLLAPYVWIAMVTLKYGRRQYLTKDYSYQPTVTIYLPIYNEEGRIRAKLENLLSQHYPIAEILILDCSTDNTPNIVKEFQQKHPAIRLIKQEKRIGMAKTFNQAIQEAIGEIFVKTDCDSLTTSQDSLRELVANFVDPRVGGATGICAAKSGIEKYFRSVQTLLQVAETNIDSTIIGHSASLLAFRRSALTSVNPDSAAEDTEELILVRKNGYKTLIDTTVVSYEEVPEGFTARRTQKDRRAHGIIQAVIRNRDILFNRKYGKYGLMVYPQFLFILVLSPLFMLSAALIIAYICYVTAPNLLLLALALIFLSYLAKPSLYGAVIDVQISGLVGTFRMLRGKNDPLWRKVR